MKAMVLGLTLLAGSSTAMAQKAPAPRPAGETAAQYTHRTELNFKEGDRVVGSVVGPDGVAVDGRRPAKAPSLVRIRTDFLAEMLRTAENL